MKLNSSMLSDSARYIACGARPPGDQSPETDTDFRGSRSAAWPELMAVAEVVDKLHAICVLCGGPASRNQRLIGGKPAPYDSPTIMVGSAESYEARCRMCFSSPRRDASQGSLL
jgi:thymidine kinase